MVNRVIFVPTNLGISLIRKKHLVFISIIGKDFFFGTKINNEENLLLLNRRVNAILIRAPYNSKKLTKISSFLKS